MNHEYKLDEIIKPYILCDCLELIILMKGDEKARSIDLNNVTQIDRQSLRQELDRHPNSIFLDLQTFDAVDLEQDGHAAPVRVRHQPDNLVRLRAGRVVVHPHRLHPILEHLLDLLHVNLQSPRDQSQDPFHHLLQLRYEPLQALPAPPHQYTSNLLYNNKNSVVWTYTDPLFTIQ